MRTVIYMNILLTTDSYPPEIRSISFMIQELAEALAQKGHCVTVVTSYPKYNLSDGGRPINLSEFSVEKNVRVIRVKALPHHKVNYLLRGIAELTLPYLFLRKVKHFVKERIDVAIVYSPPLPLTVLGGNIKSVCGARYLLNIQDIFPQNAIDLKILRNRVLISFFEFIEKQAYTKADKITVHSESNRKFLIEKKGVPSEKIITIHNWIDLATYKEIKTKGVFRKRYGLENKFIFLFAGVFGPSQYLDFIIQIAKEVSKITDICFLLVGDGNEKERLQRMVQTCDLKNVVFQPFVAKEEYPSLVKEADVGLVCVSSENKTSVFPGKILGYMAASIPIIAFLNEESDGHDLIREARCGYAMVPNDYEKASELIIKVYNEREKLEQLGHNGFEYAAANFSKNACIDKLEKLIQ